MLVPFLLFGSKSKARRVPDGQFEKRQCPECGKTTVFRECVVEKTYTAHKFIDLFSSEDTQFACDDCGAIMALEDTNAPELSARERKQREKLEAKQKKLAPKRAELERKEALEAKAKRDRAIDNELAALKAKLDREDRKSNV